MFLNLLVAPKTAELASIRENVLAVVLDVRFCMIFAWSVLLFFCCWCMFFGTVHVLASSHCKPDRPVKYSATFVQRSALGVEGIMITTAKPDEFIPCVLTRYLNFVCRTFRSKHFTFAKKKMLTFEPASLKIQNKAVTHSFIGYIQGWHDILCELFFNLFMIRNFIILMNVWWPMMLVASQPAEQNGIAFNNTFRSLSMQNCKHISLVLKQVIKLTLHEL